MKNESKDSKIDSIKSSKNNNLKNFEVMVQDSKKDSIKSSKNHNKSQKNVRKIVLGISAGSCIDLTFHFIKNLPKEIMLYVVPTNNAKVLCKAEKNLDLLSEIKRLRKLNLKIESSITSPLASGSFAFESCIVLPTSSNTLSSVASGLQENLLARVCAVCLKEKRRLILAVREMPLSPILLANMARLADIGVVIAPPVAGYYSHISTLDGLHNFLVGKYFDMLNIENSLYTRWGE